MRLKNAIKLIFANFGATFKVLLYKPVSYTHLADIIKVAMVNVFDKLKAGGYCSRLILQVHDELIIDCLKSEREEVEKLLVKMCIRDSAYLNALRRIVRNGAETLLRRLRARKHYRQISENYQLGKERRVYRKGGEFLLGFLL